MNKEIVDTHEHSFRLALDAMKRQAKAIGANDFRGDKQALKVAQLDMVKVDTFCKIISKLLLSKYNIEDVTIESATYQWIVDNSKYITDLEELLK